MNASKTDSTHDYVVVVMLEPQPVGTQFSMWPLHITLLPWFSAPGLQEAEVMCRQATQDLVPFSVDVNERAHFGQRRLPVMLLEHTTDIAKLHNRLLDGVRQKGWDMPGRYVGDYFKPHVTQKKGEDAKGNIVIDAVYIVEKLGQGYRRIQAKVALDE